MAMAVALGATLASAVYAAVEAAAWAAGEPGHLRGALTMLLAALVALGLAARVRALVWVAVALAAPGIVDLVLHSPGAELWGLRPRFLTDFDIHYYGARALYGEGGSPYGIERRWALGNTSVAFPFPTYALYWLGAGGGVLDRPASGLVWTLLNLLATAVLAALAVAITRPPDGGPGGRSVAAFLIVVSHAWGVVMTGLTTVVCAALLAGALVVAVRPRAAAALTGGVLVAAATLFKPNFFIAAVPLIAAAQRPALVMVAVAASVGASLVLTVVVPGGVSLATYVEFFRDVVPLLEEKVSQRHNVSLTGFVHGIIPGVSPTLVAGVLLVGAGALLWRQRAGWPGWFVTCLLVSPITWRSYAAVLLPAQLGLARAAAARGWTIGLVTVVLTAGALHVSRVAWVALAALLVLFWVSVRLPCPPPSIDLK